MATVYKAYEPSLDRTVALKVIRPGLSAEPDFVARFRREAQAVARLSHPSIVQVFAFDEADGQLFLAMQYLEGGTLKDRIALLPLGQLLDPAEVASIVSQVAAALSYAHGRGIVHRDVKPSNVMLTEDRAVVTDFGIAKMMSGAQLTQTGVGIGTPEYMAPEQGAGTVVDARADVYSLGVVAFELLTGRVPYMADTPFAVVAAHMRDPLPLPTSINPSLPAAAERALLRALAKDPAQRFESATTFAAALADGLRGAPAGATSVPTIVPRAARPDTRSFTFSLPALPRSRPALAAIGAAVLVVVGGTGALISGSFGRTDATPAPVTGAASTAAGASTIVTTARPATTAAASATTAPLHAVPPKGALFYQAKLDGTSGDVAELTYDTGSTPDNAVVAYAPGAVEVTLKGPKLGVGARFNAPRRTTYVGELDFTARLTSPGTLFLNTTLRGCPPTGSVFGELDLGADGQIGVIRGYGVGKSDEITPRVKVPNLADGAPHTLAFAVAADRFTLYVDEKQMADGTYGQCSNPNTGQTFFASQSPEFGGGAGTIRVTGMRYYELPADVAASASASPVPTAVNAGAAPSSVAPTPPKFAIPAKGALVFDAKLDGTPADVTGGAFRVQGGAPSDATATFAPGAIGLTVSAVSVALIGGWNSNARLDYIIEEELSPQPDSVVNYRTQLRKAAPSQGGGYISLDLKIGLGYATFVFWNPSTGVLQEISSRVPIPRLQAGKPATVAVVVQGSTYTLFLDLQQVAQVTDSRANQPMQPSIELTGEGGIGSLRITGARIYALPS